MSKLNNEERFKNVTYQHTDLRKTFARVKRELRARPAVPSSCVININLDERRKAK